MLLYACRLLLVTASDACEDHAITMRSWEAFSDLLCNRTSIIDTYSSNHTLEKLCSWLDHVVPVVESKQGQIWGDAPDDSSVSFSGCWCYHSGSYWRGIDRFAMDWKKINFKLIILEGSTLYGRWQRWQRILSTLPVLAEYAIVVWVWQNSKSLGSEEETK